MVLLFCRAKQDSFTFLNSATKTSFEDLEKFDNKFGIPFLTTRKLPGTGSYVKLEKVLAQYPNGEADIAIKGLDIFSIVSYFDEHPEQDLSLRKYRAA